MAFNVIPVLKSMLTCIPKFLGLYKAVKEIDVGGRTIEVTVEKTTIKKIIIHWCIFLMACVTLYEYVARPVCACFGYDVPPSFMDGFLSDMFNMITNVLPEIFSNL